ncbi:transcriptional regulator, Rrf2 family [Fructobacillus ficulneus]|uniref:Transcriptional regulator, Rrf2 family n=2 Tax=Fructobacillus ficulneus TaxID=157463 RepID=A0A0K8MGQ2_9LACO|nr:transcriptional regulator, Rrf2 family [Fructobacillus ficulneus]
MLATEKNHQPLSASVFSDRLGLSKTYTQKVASKLVKSGLVKSVAGKYGGLQLNRRIDDVTLLDVYRSSAGQEKLFTITDLADKTFIDSTVIHSKQRILSDSLAKAEQSFFESLASFRLSELLEDRDYQDGYIDWEAIIENERR